MNPGTSEMHFVAALDDVTELARRARPLRGRGHRGGRRLRPDRPAGRRPPCSTSARGWATAWPTSTTPGGPTARCSTSSATTPSPPAPRRPLQSDIVTVARQRLELRPQLELDRRLGRRRRCDAVAAACGPPGSVATLILPADVSWSEGGVVGPRSASSAPSPAARRPTRSPSSEAAAALRRRRATRAAHRRSGLPRQRPRAGGRRGRGHRCPAPGRDVPGPHRTRCRPATWSDRLAYLAEFAAAARGHRAPGPRGRARSPVSFFAYPGKPGDLRARRLPGPRRGRSADDVGAALEALADRGGRLERRCPIARAAAPRDCPQARSPRPGCARPSARCCPEGAIVSDEGNTELGHVRPRGHRRCSTPRLALPDRRRHRPGPPGGRSAPRWPTRAAGWSPSRQTAAPSTRSRRCGPWPGRAST